VALNFNGATITKAAKMSNWVLEVTGPNVSVSDVTLNGNRSAGAQGGGLLCEAPACAVSGVHVVGMTTNGIQVIGAGSSLTVVGSTVSGTVASESWSGNGIDAANGGVLHVSGTTSTDNSGSGFYLIAAGAGCSISGNSADNRQTGLEAGSTGSLSIGTFVSDADSHYGIDLSEDSGVQANSITASNTGAAEGGFPVNTTGSGVALFGVSNSTFVSITVTGMPGFGLDVARSTTNTFDSLTIARDGKGTVNPGINLDHDSADNVFEDTSVTGTSVGVNIGGSGAKGDPGSRDGNIGNVFQVLDVVGTGYAALNIGGGTGNVFDTINATDIRSSYPVPDRAAVRLYNSTTNDNTIDVYNSFVNGSYPTTNNPYYLVYADSAAHDNSVHFDTVQGGYKVAEFLDSNGSNTFN
jgi:hypothetical protein